MYTDLIKKAKTGQELIIDEELSAYTAITNKYSEMLNMLSNEQADMQNLINDLETNDKNLINRIIEQYGIKQ